jgi:hypothetical protein
MATDRSLRRAAELDTLVLLFCQILIVRSQLTAAKLLQLGTAVSGVMVMQVGYDCPSGEVQIVRSVESACDESSHPAKRDEQQGPRLNCPTSSRVVSRRRKESSATYLNQEGRPTLPHLEDSELTIR